MNLGEGDDASKNPAEGEKPIRRERENAESPVAPDGAPSESGQDSGLQDMESGVPPEESVEGDVGREKSGIPANRDAPGDAAEAKAPSEDALDMADDDSFQSEPAEPGTMGLLDHLNELRKRLLKACVAVCICFGFCWAFVDRLFNILMEPLLKILPAGTHAQYTTLPEAFFTRMYLALIAAIFAASPVIFYQIWAFIAPGLYDEEKKYIFPIALVSAFFFVCGALFCYFVVFPFAFNFFVSYSTPDILMTPKVSDYLSFTIKLLLAFGLIFEMPVFTLFLARLGIVTAQMMRKGRRYAIVAIFILAAILTPPDVASQLLMACPMLFLYEFSIFVAAIFGKKNRSRESEEV